MQHEHWTTPRATRGRSAARLLAIASAALLTVAGCGDTETSSADAPKSSVPSKPSVPTADERITSGLGDSAAKLDAAGCRYGTLPEQDTDLDDYHVDVDDLGWKTNPPASGRHLPEWAPWGVYDEQVPDGPAVHNLEHGGVIVWIGDDVGDDVRDAVERLPQDGEKWLVSPRAGLDGLYSVGWAQGFTCSTDALATLGPDGIETALRAWFDVAESQGAPGEKDMEAYAGSLKDPAPVRDVSTDPPF